MPNKKEAENISIKNKVNSNTDIVIEEVLLLVDSNGVDEIFTSKLIPRKWEIY